MLDCLGARWLDFVVVRWTSLACSLDFPWDLIGLHQFVRWTSWLVRWTSWELVGFRGPFVGLHGIWLDFAARSLDFEGFGWISIRSLDFMAVRWTSWDLIGLRESSRDLG